MLRYKNMWLWFGIIALWMLLTHVTGCSWPFSHKVSSNMTSVKTTSQTTLVLYGPLAWLAIACIVGVGIGVCAAIILPGDDHVPYGIVGGALTGLILSLFLLTTLWLLKWVFVALLVIGLIWLGFKIWKRLAIEKLMRTTT